MNKIILIGNLVKDPEIKNSANSVTGQPLKIASFSMAVNDRKGKDGTMMVQYFNLSAFDKTAELIEKYVKKGHKLCVTGSLRNRSWDKPDGTKGYATDIAVTELEMLTSKMDAERLNGAEGAGDANSDYSSNTANPEAFVAKKIEKKRAPEPVEDNKLPVIDVDELNIQMPF
jgi:single-strand DNA-binding protein